jgi:hypothetical protein
LDGTKEVKLVHVISQLVSSLSESEKETLLNQLLGTKQQGFPISIFRSGLSALEAISVYLRDIKEQEFTEIATLFNRSRNTIYTTYKNAKKKLRGNLDTSDVSFIIPFDIFSDRKFSILESLVVHMKDTHNVKFVKIATLLGKSYSTVKTVYDRYKKK